MPDVHDRGTRVRVAVVLLAGLGGALAWSFWQAGPTDPRHRTEPPVSRDERTEQAQERDRRDRVFLAALDRARQKAVLLTRSGFDRTGAARAYATAFRDHGLDVLAVPPDAAIDWVRSRTPALHGRIVFALLHWSMQAGHTTERDRLRALVARLGLDPWADHFLAVVQAGRIDILREMADEAATGDLSGVTLEVLAQGVGDLVRRDLEIAFLTEVQGHHPDDFWINFRLGSLLARDAGTDERQLLRALGYLHAAVALAPYSGPVRGNLASVLDALGERQAAHAAYLRALELEPEAVIACNLGLHHEQAKDFDRALLAYERALQIDPDHAGSCARLALLLCRPGGDLHRARALAWKAIELDSVEILLSLAGVLGRSREKLAPP